MRKINSFSKIFSLFIVVSFLIIVLVFILSSFANMQDVTVNMQDVTVTRGSGGSIQTQLSYGILVNKGSSLTREWIIIHDNSLPADLVGTVGVTTTYSEGGRYSRDGYNYNANYTVSVKEPLTAIEVRFLTFDIWGNHVRNLSSTDILDLQAETLKVFTATWNIYSENEVSEYYASIGYVAQMRTKSGRVIKMNPEYVLEEARKFSKKFSEEDLEPTPEKK